MIRYILKVVIIIILILLFCSSVSNASTWGDIFEQGDIFISEGKNATNPINGQALKDARDIIYNVLFALGVCLSVIIGAILGIKYMFGSVEQQVKVKETLVPYIISCIIIFSAFGIWKFVIEIASKVT